MVKKIETSVIKLWNDTVGAVTWLDDQSTSIFEYDQSFLSKGLDIAPIHMSIEETKNNGNLTYSFPSLNKETFLGLPGLLADALPDKFGNSIIDAWLARNGRDSKTFSPIERLCYTGKRGMGALEFFPPAIDKYERAVPVEISELVQLTQEIMNQREEMNVNLTYSEKENSEAIKEILRVGTSAGGARPKAVIAMNNESKHILSGQTQAPEGYDYWIIKFDDVTDIELGKPKNYCRIEYAYYLMAKAAGINMTECKLLEENGRAHFMTKRFDRKNGEKLHMQSLCGIAHYDFNQADAYSYEQAFSIMRNLRLSHSDIIQQYRRALFNITARNQDDHTKNIAFLMDKSGTWQLSPAFDVTYSHNPHGQWTNLHQMSFNGKRDHFTMQDFFDVADIASIPHPKEIIQEVISAVKKWGQFAKQAQTPETIIGKIQRYHCLDF